MGDKQYRSWAPRQGFLLPPSPLKWLPEGHLAYFILELVEALDLGEMERAIQTKDPRGTRPYSPAMMTAFAEASGPDSAGRDASSQGPAQLRRPRQSDPGEVDWKPTALEAYPDEGIRE